MRLSKYAILATAFLAILSGSIAALDDGLVGYWQFDLGSGSTVVDHSGYGNNGTIDGASWVQGVKGYALSFDGSNDGVTIPESSSLNFDGESAVSTTLWVKFHGNGDGCCDPLVGQRDDPGHSWVLRYDDRTTENGIELLVYDGNNWMGDEDSYGIAKPANGEWHFLAAVYDGSEIRLYKDGELIERYSFSGDIQASGSRTTMGTASDGSLHASLDRVRVYKRALSTTEIKKIYNNKTGICDSRGPQDECVMSETNKLDATTYSISSVFVSKDTAVIESLDGQATLDITNSSFISGLWRGSFHVKTQNPVIRPGAVFRPRNGDIVLGR